MQNTITFQQTGHDSFIDFIKAYAIVCVLIAHTLPAGFGEYIGSCLWLDMQVPLFVLVQSFHSLKRPSHIDLRKIIFRILFPFLIAQMVLCVLLSLFQDVKFPVLCESVIRGGGRGPGSYYPWIYIQLAILLPLVAPIFNNRRMSRTKYTLIAILICEFFEVLFSIISLPENVYRLLAVRYFFLIYLAILWVKDGIIINKTTISISFVSLVSIVYFSYFAVDDEPLFFNTAWKFHRWPCYAYVAIMGVGLLHALYLELSRFKIIESFCNILAKSSYEIFLVQMIVLEVWPKQSTNTICILFFKRLLIYFLCIVGGYWLCLVYKRFTKRFHLL